MQEIIIKIKNELKTRDITYAKFAQMTGISEYTLKHIFSDKVPNPRIDTISAMLDALEMQGYTRKPEGAVLTELEMQIMEMVTNCSEREQKMVASYLAGILDTRNLGNIKVEVPDRINHYKKNPKY